MKLTSQILATAAIGLASLCIAAAADMMSDGVMMKSGQMTVTKDGNTMAMTDTIEMRNGDKVMTDGTVMTPDGQKMMMRDGDSMNMDGTLMRAGSTAPMAAPMAAPMPAPIADGFMMKDGTMMFTRNGKSAQMMENMRMDDGTMIYRDGTIIKHDGGRTVLENGDSMGMDGTMTKARM